MLTQPTRFVIEHKGCSGDMDMAGTAACVGYLRAKHPELVRGAVLVEDGDAKTRKWAMEDWRIAKCKCHKGKNLSTSLKKNMPGITCTCRCNGVSCTTQTGCRYKDTMARHAAARFHHIIRQAELKYLPEKGLTGAWQPVFGLVGSPERETKREEAITWARGEIIAMAHHFAGNDTLCSHCALPDDHPTLRCEAQIEHLAEVMRGLAGCVHEILSPFGALDINATESCHSVLRRYREKGLKWGAVPCFLGETFGFLHWQRLQLAFWGTKRNPWAEFADVVNGELGLNVEFSAAELEEMDAQLEASITAKEKRSAPEFRSQRAAYRARKGGYAASSAASSSYQSGGSRAAVSADALAAEEAYLGCSNGGAGLDPDVVAEEQRASVMTDPDPEGSESEEE